MKLDGLCTLISVFDCNVSSRFYCDALGFQVHQQAGRPDWVWLKREGIDLMLNTMYDPEAEPDAPEPERIRAHEDTILYFGCSDVERAYEELKGKGLVAEPPKIAPYGMKQLYIRDPDGYGICLQCPAS